MICKYFTPHMAPLRELCRRFRTLEGCSTGGPLHILLDDGNYEDNHIQFCLNECSKHQNKMVVEWGTTICQIYLRMSMKERAIFDLYLWDRSIECGYTFCTPHCPLIKEVADD